MKKLILIFLIVLTSNEVLSQIDKAPERYRGEGPYNQLIIRGATLINGNGSPPTGPVDIVIEKNVIKRIVNVGYPGIEIKENRRPKLIKTGIEIDAEGKFIYQVLLTCTGIYHLKILEKLNMFINCGWPME